jgi:polyhydroxyalkanoate synthesis regulator phasin
MAHEQTREFANELIDIETALGRGEITSEEARYLITELRDVRAAQSLAKKEILLAQVIAVATVAAKLIP